MSVWSTANSSPTRDPRVRVGQWGAGNWRTLVRDDDDWNETGPPYPSRAVALGHVDDVLAGYFGELPSRALLAGRIEQALAIAAEGGSFRKVERMTQALQGHLVAGPPAELREEDLEVSTVRPGAIPHGSGGQTVGQFDSYVRVTHRPTGIVVERDSERSQLMNKSAALDELRRQLVSQPAYPLITVSVLGDMFDPYELRTRVAAQLRTGNVEELRVGQFKDEAAGDDYAAVLAVARRWVRVSS
jgi:hypothetical protein